MNKCSTLMQYIISTDCKGSLQLYHLHKMRDGYCMPDRDLAALVTQFIVVIHNYDLNYEVEPPCIHV